MLGSAKRTRSTFLAIASAAVFFPRRASAQSAPILCSSSPDDDVSPFLYAQQAGLFKREGLDVTFQASNSGAAVAAAVAGGSVNIGKSSVMALISARSRGIAFTLIAPSGLYSSENPVVTMLVKKDAPIKTPRDLNGKTISVPSIGDLYTIAGNAFIDAGGGDSKSVHYLELPSSAAPQAVIEGRVDAVTLTTPILMMALDSGKLRALGHPFDAIANRFMQAAWFVTEDFAAKNRGTVERFARVMHEASVYANAHHAETAPMLAALTKLDPSTIARMPRANNALALDPALVQPVIDLAVKYRSIPQTFDARAMLYKPLS